MALSLMVTLAAGPPLVAIFTRICCPANGDRQSIDVALLLSQLRSEQPSRDFDREFDADWFQKCFQPNQLLNIVLLLSWSILALDSPWVHSCHTNLSALGMLLTAVAIFLRTVLHSLRRPMSIQKYVLLWSSGLMLQFLLGWVLLYNSAAPINWRVLPWVAPKTEACITFPTGMLGSLRPERIPGKWHSWFPIAGDGPQPNAMATPRVDMLATLSPWLSFIYGTAQGMLSLGLSGARPRLHCVPCLHELAWGLA